MGYRCTGIRIEVWRHWRRKRGLGLQNLPGNTCRPASVSHHPSQLTRNQRSPEQDKGTQHHLNYPPRRGPAPPAWQTRCKLPQSPPARCQADRSVSARYKPPLQRWSLFEWCQGWSHREAWRQYHRADFAKLQMRWPIRIKTSETIALAMASLFQSCQARVAR